MNYTIQMGSVTNEPTINDARTVARYGLAVRRDFSKEGEPDTDFLNIVAFGKQVEFVEKFIRKGMRIAVEGQLRTGSYEKDGVKHNTCDIIVSKHHFCERKSEGMSQINAPIETDFMSIPDGIVEELPFN